MRVIVMGLELMAHHRPSVDTNMDVRPSPHVVVEDTRQLRALVEPPSIRWRRRQMAEPILKPAIAASVKSVARITR